MMEHECAPRSHTHAKLLPRGRDPRRHTDADSTPEMSDPMACEQTAPRRTARARLSLAAALLLGIGAVQLRAQPLLDEDTQRLLVEAVEAASELDLYGARCRRDVSGRHTDNLNKVLASKFRMTVLEVEDDLFPEKSYRRAKDRLQRDFLAKLKEAGGCKEAKRSGMPASLRERYDALMGGIDALP